MPRFRDDPLLAGARGFITPLIALLLIALAAMVAGIPLVVIYRHEIHADLAEQYGRLAAGNDLTPAFVALIGTGVALVALAWRFLLLLRRIVDSVASDPFIPKNAERLRQMGWLTLAAQAVTIPAIFISAWMSALLDDVDFKFHFSLGALLLALVLFVLARVFKRGAEMRADLEGTV
jgi:hypothetical protein